MYNKYDKKSEEQKNLHILKYRKYKDIIKDIIISNNIFEFDDISPKRNRELYVFRCYDTNTVL